ncbi:uncharacterized protein LOC127861272 [Dreissena polymorpha]|uniref:Claudin n=1 Tax=Dreissena polymorpha TaxID=45954 RepID=A0A9D4BDW8_DREPO|nr:uncharacterized protein LOC127861272 [Dreissena polymorpha]KAH3699300.1 hypothetical protein DPMN_074255 [Dreissena polymorpha]
MANGFGRGEPERGRKSMGIDVKVIVMFAVLGFATILQLAALISDSWVRTATDADGTVGSSGLWRICPDYAGIDSCRAFVWTDNQVSHWFRTVQTFEVVGFLFGCSALFMMALYHLVETCMENTRLKMCSMALLVVAFMLVFSGAVVVASLKDAQKAIYLPDTYVMPSWGFAFAIVASIVYLVGCVTIVISN